MSEDNGHSNPAAIPPQSEGGKQKAAGRVANMKRINMEGLAGSGGRPVEHGEYALAARYKAGLSPEGPLYPILRQHRDNFLSDLGGEANASAKEIQACEWLGFLTVLYGLQVAQLSQAKRLSRRELADLTQAVTRTAGTFGQIAKQLGFQRRQVEAGGPIIIRRSVSNPASDKSEGSHE